MKSLSPSTIEPFGPNLDSNAIETSQNYNGSPMEHAATEMENELEQQNDVANGKASPKVEQTPEVKPEVTPGAVTNEKEVVATVYAGGFQDVADANAQQAAQNDAVQQARSELDNEVMNATQVKREEK